jgi:hypothetical protein
LVVSLILLIGGITNSEKETEEGIGYDFEGVLAEADSLLKETNP